MPVRKSIRLGGKKVPVLPQPKRKPSRIVSKLKNPQVFILYKWVEGHKTTVRANDNVTVARMASADLKLPLNEHHIRGAREGLGMPVFKTRGRVNNGNAVTDQRLDLLMTAVEELAQATKHATGPAMSALRVGFGRSGLPIGEKS